MNSVVAFEERIRQIVEDELSRIEITDRAEALETIENIIRELQEYSEAVNSGKDF